MTLKQFHGPANGRDVLTRELALRAHRASLIKPLEGTPHTGSPIPSYYLGVDDFEKDRPLVSAHQTGWYFPIVGGKAPGLAIIHDTKDGSGASFQGIVYGILPERLLEAGLLADQKLGPVVEEYEPRLLDVPELQFIALWLFGPKDLFIPLLDGGLSVTAPLRLVSNVIPKLKHVAHMGAPDRSSPRDGAPTN